MTRPDISFEAIGTSWKISLPGVLLRFEGRPLADRLSHLKRLIKERISKFDKDYSRFRGDSLVARMSKSAGEYELPEDAEPMFTLYEKLYALTKGKVTPLIGKVLEDAGYDSSYSLDPKPAIDPARPMESVMRRSGRKLTMLEPALLDFGAAGKGYLVDIVGGLLKAEGEEDYTIDAGGDIAHGSSTGNKLVVALEDPTDPSKAVGKAEISGKSICGSSGNRRAWKGYHHIMDPHAVASPTHIKALWTVADTTMEADGLSTALFFVEPETLSGNFNFEYAILYADGSGRTSPGFPGTFF